MSRLTFLIGLFCLSSLSPLHAAGVQLGPLCVEGVSLVEKEADKTLEGDGYWYPISLNYKKSGGAKPATLVLFDRPLPPTPGLSSCAELANRAKAQGVGLILSGTLKSIQLAGDFFRAASPNDNRLQIKPGKFLAEVETVSAGSANLAGGTINLKGGKLSIGNLTQYLGGIKVFSGQFEIEIAGRKLANVPVVPLGGAKLQTTFASTNSGASFKIRVNMLSRQVQLWSGTLSGTPTGPLTGSAATFAGLAFTSPNLTIAKIGLVALSGNLSVELDGVKGKADRIIWKHQSVGVSLDQPTIQWSAASGTASATSTELNVLLPVLKNANFKSPATILTSEGQPDLLSGAFQAGFAILSETLVDGQLTWTSPRSSALAFLVPPTGADSVNLSVKGRLSDPVINGKVRLNQLSLAGAQIQQPLSLQIENAHVSADLKIPIKFDVHDVSGHFTLADLDQKALITAGIRRAFLDAVLTITLADLRQSHLDVPTNNLELTLFAAVAAQPLVAGTAPTFGDLDVTATNPVPLVVALASTGEIDILPKLLVLGEPIFRIGHKGTESRAALKIQADAGAIFAFDLASGVLALTKADLQIKDADFHFLDHNGVIDISGIEITDPEIKLGYLKIVYDQRPAVRIGKADGANFSFNGAKLEKPFDPAKPTEVTYTASLPKAFTVKEFHALKVDIARAISFELIDVKKVDLVLTGANAKFGDGFKVKSANLTFTADELATVMLNGMMVEQFDHAHFAADGSFDPGNQLSLNNDPSFSIEVNVTGIGTQLNGSGKASIGGFTGSKQAAAEIPFPCDDGHKPKAGLEYNFGSAGLSMDVTVHDGKFDAEADIGPLVLFLHTKSGVQCNGVQQSITASIDVPVPPYPCGSFFDPKLCTTVNVSVTGKYHIRYEVLFSAGSIELTDAELRFGDGQPKVCNKGLIDASKLAVVPNIYPQIDNYIPGITEVANATLQVSFVLPETILSTSIVSGIGLFASTTLSAAGKIGCL